MPILGFSQVVKQFNNIKVNGDTIYGVINTLVISTLASDTTLFNRAIGTITPKTATDTLNLEVLDLFNSLYFYDNENISVTP